MTEYGHGNIRTLHKLLIGVIICVASLALMENIARIYEVEVHDPFSLRHQFSGDGRHGDFLSHHGKFVRDPELFWRIKPHFGPLSYNYWSATLVTETTNSLGFRGRDEYGPKASGIYRVIALGDSWTYGVMVNDDETYPAQLSRLLNASSEGRRFEVLNLGCVGYTSYQGKVLLAKYIRQLTPDLITVCFGHNDSRRTRMFSDRQQPRPGEWVILIQSMLGKSQFYQAMRNCLLRVKKKAASRGGGVTPAEKWPQRASPDEYEANLKEIISIARENNSRAILLCYHRDGPYRDRTVKASEEEGVPLVDVYEILNKDPRYRVEDLSVDYPRDPHPNARGYSLIAHRLEALVREVADGNPSAGAPPPR